ncbi:phosphatidate cytidylyltransferase [Mumia sp. zg.B53]|uniref:phosphatidate cytidylyltransferase n=1 Tax=unclassified Mumia TaxID=2621872 RepID=UPI001C6E1A83|nr:MULTISPECIES: phosphatidate cytidylyltransferase [unclassified Mumia]MBW9205517.1 phosphatidate cytidylyltransferase [Mumia sp. zg.B17]MBW9208482.1 phosphatidate cytidylyltransferase [Mumia sp. zg.B21]MBW9216439.1 phosphatidate cytidylyltransferase [Mumia sp. zg.B53]MDD9348772.1 phosphatidate cytidylyltransferase [Mumia sp.]
MSSPDVPAAPQQRGGRDLPAAIGVGVGLAGAVIISLFFVKALFVLVVVTAGAVAIWELSSALAKAGIAVPLPPLMAGGLATLAAAYVGGTEAIAIGAALTVLGVFVYRMPRGADGFVRDTSAAVFIFGYVPVLGSFVVLMAAEDDGAWRIVTFIVVTIASDIFGYAAGYKLGKHPMAPTISPKKSWEGFAGSVLGCVLAGVLCVVLLLDGRWWVGVLLGLAAVAMATLGDLSESMIKRDVGIKDMSDLLPGHGGLMDRLDSLLAVAPICWLVLHFLVPVA